MEDSEEVRRLQTEVSILQKDLRDMYARLQQVQQRLRQIDPKGSDEVAPRPVPVFSLENFIGLRLIHLVGIVVLVIGVSIGVKYAFDRNLISETTRIMLAYAAGAVLLLLSIRLQKQYAAFSAILFSGAMATFYFTSYAAHVYYNLMPFGVVFGLMMLLTVFTAFEAVRYNRPEVALLGLIGAYGIPFLISRNADRAELLFLYIAIINLGVLYLRIKKDWPTVGRVALVVTWTLFIGWASTRYRINQQGTAALFLIFFYFLFLPMLPGRNYRHTIALRSTSHSFLLHTGAAFIAALYVFAPAYQQGLIAHVALFFALTAALQGLAAQYFFGGIYLRQVMYFLSVAFLVLATALYFDGLHVTFVWLALSVALFGMGIWLRDKTWRMAALGLMALTLIKLLVVDSQRFSAGQKVAAYLALGLLLLVVSFLYQKFRQKWFGE